MSLLILLGFGKTHTAGAPPWDATWSIAGVNRDAYVRVMENFDLTFRLGSRAILRATVVDRDHIVDTENAYRPQIDDDVIATDRHTLAPIYTGKILNVEDDSFENHRGVATRIECVSNQMALARRVVVGKSYDVGTTLKEIAQDLISTYLTEFSITLNPAMLPGPTLSERLDIDGIYVEDAFRLLSKMFGWVYRLEPTNVLDMFEVGSIVSPYDLDGDAIYGKVIWKKTKGTYANRVILRAGGNKTFPASETFQGNGVTRIFPLSYRPTEWVNSYYDGGYVHTAPYEVPSLFEFNFDVANRRVIQQDVTSGVPHPPIQPGHTLRVDYTAQGPITVIAKDDAEIALRGSWDTIVDEPDITDIANANLFAANHLDRRLALPRSVVVNVKGGYVSPGSVLTFNLPKRQISGQWLVTAARGVEREDGKIAWTLELLEGLQIQSNSWLDFWKNLVGGNTSGTGASGGTYNPVPPSQQVITRQVYFLGGSNIEYVRGAAAAWIPSSAMRVTLQGPASMTVRARLRARTGTVIARLQNVSDNITVGTSGPVSTPNWTDVAFPVTPTGGSKLYELQIQPTLANTDVAAIGYVE